MADRGICSIDGCTSPVLARSWCGKHYSRWRTNGDPLSLQRVVREPNAPEVRRAFVGGQLVHFTAADDAFVTVRRKRGSSVIDGRRYGFVITCEACGRESFNPTGTTKHQFRFCSHKCAGPATGHAKLGRSKPGAKKRVDVLDRMFSVLIRVTGGACVNCGSTQNLQCAHGFSRRYRNVRWDMRNAFCLCARCHVFYTHRPLEWDEWLKDRWGLALYGQLRVLALRTDTKVNLEEICDALVAETIRLGITANQLPKTMSGWRGLRDVRTDEPTAP